MLVILVTVITQGPRVDPALKGNLKGSLGIQSGIFQAIGVISFGACLPVLLADPSIAVTNTLIQLSFAVSL